MTTTGDARDRLAGFDRARFDGQLQLHSEGPPSQGFRHIGAVAEQILMRIAGLIAEPRDCLAEQGSDDRPCH